MTDRIAGFRARKGGAKLVTMTALDYPTALWCRKAGVDLILVGDSLGMVSLGKADTIEVTLSEMVSATGACVRAVRGSEIPLVADLPFEALTDPVGAATALRSAGADAVKIECHQAGLGALDEVLRCGIPVMAHIGLLPQEVRRLGGYKVQGRTEDEASEILAIASRVEEAGAFACVVENVPEGLADRITRRLTIPTIGIGAGRKCDGQILVLYDLLGVDEKFKPRFARRYVDFGAQAVEAIQRFAEDVRRERFPAGDEITR